MSDNSEKMLDGLSDEKKKMAIKVSNVLGEDAMKFAHTGLFSFFDSLTEKDASPERALFTSVLSFVCYEINKGKLILVDRDKKPETEIKLRAEKQL